jgi:hypothetical protein
MKDECEYLHSDWCHHPDLEFQELCSYYYCQANCPVFKRKVGVN